MSFNISLTGVKCCRAYLIMFKQIGNTTEGIRGNCVTEKHILLSLVLQSWGSFYVSPSNYPTILKRWLSRIFMKP